MKLKLSIFLCALCLCAGSVFASSVTFPFTDANGNPIANTKGMLIPMAPLLNNGTGNLTSRQITPFTTDGTGTYIAPNLQAGLFEARLLTSPNSYWQVQCPNDNLSYFAWQLVPFIHTNFLFTIIPVGSNTNQVTAAQVFNHVYLTNTYNTNLAGSFDAFGTALAATNGLNINLQAELAGLSSAYVALNNGTANNLSHTGTQLWTNAGSGLGLTSHIGSVAGDMVWIGSINGTNVATFHAGNTIGIILQGHNSLSAQVFAFDVSGNLSTAGGGITASNQLTLSDGNGQFFQSGGLGSSVQNFNGTVGAGAFSGDGHLLTGLNTALSAAMLGISNVFYTLGIKTTNVPSLFVYTNLSVSGLISSSNLMVTNLATVGAWTNVAGNAGLDASGKLTAITFVGLPVGSSSQAGVVKVDGTTITAAGGVISSIGGGGSVGNTNLLSTNGTFYGNPANPAPPLAVISGNASGSAINLGLTNSSGGLVAYILNNGSGFFPSGQMASVTGSIASGNVPRGTGGAATLIDTGTAWTAVVTNGYLNNFAVTNHSITTSNAQGFTTIGPSNYLAQVGASGGSSTVLQNGNITTSGTFTGNGGGLTNVAVPERIIIYQESPVGGVNFYCPIGATSGYGTQTNAYTPAGEYRSFSAMLTGGGPYPLTGTNVLFVLQKNGVDTTVSNVMGFTGTTNVSTGSVSVIPTDELDIRNISPATLSSVNINITIY